ncbi:MAG TPA: hypothetical protein IGS17_06670 [Oscillatoriales cyanobacterium M59_W2019_021]|nr:MAG: hypothetical protein D6728_18010 [Cyanobacteria bacterium J055]HIK29816.1 hypothetical protein [Oscillatoriales cyanobacterium M4454_W2019_049]HIK50596.1 hypothetical protein [Oscillatoriales cyanobacterium M59_W2019_021]
MFTTLSHAEVLERTARSIRTGSAEKLAPAELVAVLLELEKLGKSQKQTDSFDRLVGTWRLAFVTGTKKSRQRAGIVLGAGRYLPKWVEISLSYTPVMPEEARQATPDFEVGWVQNRVALATVQLSLSGPVKFLRKNNLLAFDFTRIQASVFGIKFYEGYIRGGRENEETFDRERIGKQAFFNYFWIGETAIAARGRGGGLALWVRL